MPNISKTCTPSSASLVRSLTILSAIVLTTAIAACTDSEAFTLYRNSPVGADMRIHVASFNAADGEAYNRENCQVAASLFKTQSGVTVAYWCEKGQYRK